MLKGDGNENSNKIITCNEHKNKFVCAAHFSVHFLSLFCTTAMPFCTTKT